MSSLGPSARDLYLRYQNEASNWVECHRIWGDSVTYFFNLRSRTCEAMDPPVKVSLSNEVEYRQYKGYKGAAQ
jgi:hypothetical protein